MVGELWRAPYRLTRCTIRGAARTTVEVATVAGDVVRAGSKEAATAAAHVILYPAGLLSEADRTVDPRFRIDNLTPVTRGLILSDIEAHGTPIVLVHGLVDNRSAFAVLRRALRRRGFGRISTVNYSPLTADVPSAAARLGRHIERICAQSGYEKVHVVGHSLGGVIARYYVQRQGGDRRVDTLVTLGSPHLGSNLARLFPFFVARQLHPDSRVIRELARPARCSSRFVAIWSDFDEAIIPAANARLDHPDLNAVNIRVHGVGHLALLVDYDAVRSVIEILSARGAIEPSWERRRATAPHPAFGGAHDRRRRRGLGAPAFSEHVEDEQAPETDEATTLDEAEILAEAAWAIGGPLEF
ncbi:alpha/beta hydrolase fold [Frankineae bacterium MT45]|nr:alpha/beta hydrolase fold [Frankineae bacterium MT45]